MYLNGDGTKADYAEALKWLTMAAKAGDSLGQFKLGVMYENAMGVPQDRVTALMWYTVSAAQGNEAATKAIDPLKKQMSFMDVGKAQDMAKAFKPAS